MAEQNVITSMLDDLSKEQPISTAICIGQDLEQYNQFHPIQWQHFNVTEFLNLPFTQRFDLGFVILDTETMLSLDQQQKTQMLVKLRDLFAKRIVVVSKLHDEQLLRALGFTQLIDKTTHESDFALWQFNILTYKHIPDWFNSKFWANPENWDKFRW
ncbi:MULTISPECIES: DUF6231 family protein [Acinetobacter]|jgi:hypothetical protein|uniref:Uncharacterized protein n=1 Tax=Acinetobacter amyesii TaxID=2942470 RepID=A0A1T1H5V7_9GAMM|nr:MULTISPECIES: DUF6231 family protein [Acinetobacter]MCL6238339.1 DUF6231 family protein [Acinetobacter amyesii]MCL6243453.1 DUF6231 family protein [Acinetobacter amyesii]MCL6248362.1 DUF6231 family protein [Acinetobacter amyesii]OOV81480.1 hypothetical protein B1201_10450 [Acinetobacter sp. ANC 5600]OOV85251.1 hypothetical protein B1202_00950 [Acinetobacter amyesii]